MAAEQGMQRVAGYCPMGCGETLFLGNGGHVTCSYVECINPTRADALLERDLSRVRTLKLHVLWAHGTGGQEWAATPQFVAAVGEPFVRQFPTAYASETELMKQRFVEQQGPAEFVTTVEAVDLPGAPS